MLVVRLQLQLMRDIAAITVSGFYIALCLQHLVNLLNGISGQLENVCQLSCRGEAGVRRELSGDDLLLQIVEQSPVARALNITLLKKGDEKLGV